MAGDTKAKERRKDNRSQPGNVLLLRKRACLVALLREYIFLINDKKGPVRSPGVI